MAALKPKGRQLRPAARIALALITLAGLVSTAWQGYRIYGQTGAATEFIIDEARSRAELLAASKSAITGEYFNRRVAELIDDCDLATAESYLAVGRAQGLTLSAEVEAAYVTATGWQARTGCVAGQAGYGFLTGEGASVSHIGGAVLSDFLVYGDLRDIAKQSYNYASGANVDEFILVISGLGLAATAGTYLSAGLAAPARSAISLIKFAKRSGRLTARFAGHLAASMKRVLPAEKVVTAYKSSSLLDLPKTLAKSVDQAEMAKLTGVFDNLSGISKSTDNLTALRLLKHVETPRDLVKLKAVAKIGGRQTLAWTDRFGAGLLKLVKPVSKLTARLLGEIALLALGAAVALVSALAGFGSRRVARFAAARFGLLYRA